MKKRLSAIPLILFVFILISSASAYNGYSNFGGISISELASSEWFNAAVLFVFIFAVLWFAVQKMFGASKPAAFVIAVVIALIGSFGVIYYYGLIITKFAWWIVALAILAAVVSLYSQLKKQGTIFYIVLLAISLLWFLFARNSACLTAGVFPHSMCNVLDAVAIVFIIIPLFKLLISLRKLLKGKKFADLPENKPPKNSSQPPSKAQSSGKLSHSRTASKLRSKYRDYKKLYKQEWDNYQKRAKKQGLRQGIPPNNSPEGRKRHRYLQAIKAIEKIAQNKGITL